MRSRVRSVSALALGSLIVMAGTASAGRDTKADYTPVEDFAPLAMSAVCGPATTQPFVLPAGFGQTIVAQEGDGGTIDLWDMSTQNESGKDAGRYIYRAHEVSNGGQLSVTDLSTGQTEVLAQRADWERFDGIVWSPWGTLLTGEEVGDDAVDDPAFPAAEAGLIYEFFIDPNDPTELITNDPRDTVAPFDDGVAARPAVGSRSHEGMRFDRHGNFYGISEVNGGSIFRFTPDKKGDLSGGTLAALDTPSGHDGEGTWVEIPDADAALNSQTAATALGANGYNRPEDVETDESTGKDKNNGGQTLYVAATGTEEVIAVDLRQKDKPYVYDYVFNTNHSATSARVPNATSDFDSPDNLALDEKGNIAITEDPSTNVIGADIWVAAPPKGGPQHQAAMPIGRLASLTDCSAEPTGIYFAMDETKKFVKGTPLEGLVTDETLFVHRQHASLGQSQDQLVAIDPQ